MNNNYKNVTKGIFITFLIYLALFFIAVFVDVLLNLFTFGFIFIELVFLVFALFAFRDISRSFKSSINTKIFIKSIQKKKFHYIIAFTLLVVSTILKTNLAPASIDNLTYLAIFFPDFLANFMMPRFTTFFIAIPPLFQLIYFYQLAHLMLWVGNKCRIKNS